MAAGKWIEELTPATTTEDAARRVLGLRLEVVRQYLVLALREPEKDTEYVHQLRVGTRRARAALDIFACCLPLKIYKRAKREMRDLRRAAGRARDWDVFLAELSERAAERPPRRGRAGLDYLTGYAMSHRLEAQDILEKAVPDAFALDRLDADLLHAVGQPQEGPNRVLDLARPTLQGLVEEVERAAAGDLSNYDNLHLVRIAGKRLRYAMEVFAGCFAEEFRTVHYAAIEQMQEILGDTNDSHVACQRLELLRARTKDMLPAQWKRYKSDINELFQFHEQRLAEGLPRFEEWWRDWQENGGRDALLGFLQSTEAVEGPALVASTSELSSAAS